MVDGAGSAAARAIGRAIEEHWDELRRDARVYVHALDLRGDREALAQDALQDAVVTALRAAASYDTNRPALPWLRRILFNVLRTRRRDDATERRFVVPLAEAARGAARAQHERGKDPSTLTDDELLGQLGAAVEGPEGGEATDLEELLALVDDADRLILRLRVEEGLTGRPLADRLGISTGAAYTRLSRAKDRLRAAWSQSGRAGEEEARDAT
jgi:RNA polymerase sigma factor (sigma-70 family)